MHKEAVNFLDVTVYKGNRFHHHGILDSKVYFKETDTHELLDHHSFHPKHTFPSIVKSQLLRFMRICNNMVDFHEATKTLFTALREKRHYSNRFLRLLKSQFLKQYKQLGEQEFPLGASMKCKNKRCQCCLRIREDSYYSNFNSEWAIEKRLDCQSKNIIYVIECKKCKIQYVGETERSLALRLNNHLSDIDNYKDTAIPNHFLDDCWPPEDNFCIFPIEQIYDRGSKIKNKKNRLIREAYWIKQLETQFPEGLNSKLHLKRNMTVTMKYNSTSLEAFKLIRNTNESLKQQFPLQL